MIGVPWEDIFKLSTSAGAREFCECIQVGFDVCITQAWKFGGNDHFITASFPLFIKDGNDNLFPQIHLHNTNAFFEDLTGKYFYNLAYKLHCLHTDVPTLHK